MADLINNNPNLADLVSSALQSSRSLHLTVRGLPSQSPIPELTEQLKALDTALQKLAQILTTRSTEFTALELPLRYCDQRCKELKEQISQYRDPDILGFIHTLKLHTSTIVIGMLDVALYVNCVQMWTSSDTYIALPAISYSLQKASRSIRSLSKILSRASDNT